MPAAPVVTVAAMELQRVPQRESHMATSKLRRWTSRVSVVVAVLGFCAGCYDSDALLNRASSDALRTTLAEVDLGSFHTTLPRDANAISLTELRLHLFAAVPRYHAPEVEKKLQAEEFLLRHEMLAVVRKATPADLAEPSLGQLRKRLKSVVNDILDDSPVKFVGFYDFALRRT
jgi:hypothetical protein